MTEHRAPTYHREFALAAVAAVAGVILLYWVVYWIAITVSPLSKDIDFNADGNISLLEAIEGATIRSQSVVVDGRRCIDYFEPKTGGQWRLVCERP
jgi:hypothetical protein